MAARPSISKWGLVALLSVLAALNYADRTAISSVFPLLRADLGASDLALAAVGSFFLWSYAAGSPLAGLLSDRVSRVKVIVWSVVAWSLVTVWTGLAASVEELLLTRVFLGLAECAYLPASMALIADYHASHSRATAIGFHSASLRLGVVAGGTLAGYLGERSGWRLPFFVLGVIGLLLAALTQWLLGGSDASGSPRLQKPENKPLETASTSAWASIATLVRIPTYLIIVVEGMMLAVGTWMFNNWLPLYLNETYQMSLTAAGFWAATLLQISGTAGVPAGGWWSDRVAGRQPHRRMLLQALCYLVSAPFLLAFVGGVNFGALGSCIFLFSFWRSVGGANQAPILCDLLPPRLRATGIAMMNTTNTLAGGVGIFIAGYLKQDYGLAGVFAGVSIIVFAAAVLLYLGYRFFIRKDLERCGVLTASGQMRLAATE